MATQLRSLLGADSRDRKPGRLEIRLVAISRSTSSILSTVTWLFSLLVTISITGEDSARAAFNQAIVSFVVVVAIVWVSVDR